jgi:hypothetical protein
LALLLTGCVRRDFAGLCKLAKEILGEPRITSNMRFERFVHDAPNVAFSSAARDVVAALPRLEPAQRYPAIIGAARSQGMDDWSCPALQSVVDAER